MDNQSIIAIYRNEAQKCRDMAKWDVALGKDPKWNEVLAEKWDKMADRIEVDKGDG